MVNVPLLTAPLVTVETCEARALSQVMRVVSNTRYIPSGNIFCVASMVAISTQLPSLS